MEKMHVIYIDFGKGHGWERGPAYEANEYGYKGAESFANMARKDGFKAKIELEDKRKVMSLYCGLEEAS